jgi:hypothetical protein
MLEQCCHVGLVAAHTIQALGQHDLELAVLRALRKRLMPARRIMVDSETAASL